MIFFFSFEVAPQPGSDNWEKYGGAQVNCWIRADDLNAARKRALELVRSDSWVPTREDESREVAEGHYEAGSSGRASYEDATRLGEAFVVHTWPPDGDEDQVIH